MARYHRMCEKVNREHERGLITEEQALERLRDIERGAYERNPHAEPDGDITFCVAMTVDEIRDRS